jgi:broad specificity polyphosphatase/5'/3'-nucleotidase SurE
LTTIFSGTIGAASAAADQLSIPGIAFSGATGVQTAWNIDPVPDYVLLYADLAANFTNILLKSGKPYLPPKTWLNVNFPHAGTGTNCTKSNQFKFVFSRIHDAVPFITPEDVNTCNNNGRLPTESKVIGTKGCYCSISVGRANDKLDSSASDQTVVLNKLQKILSCLP